MAKKPAIDPTKTTHPPRLFQPKDQVVLSYHVIIPAGHTLEQIMDKNYFCHSAKRCKRHARIEYTAEDFSFSGELLVMSVDDNTVQTLSLAHRTHDVGGVEDPSANYKIGQDAKGFRVIHKVTGEIIKADIPNRKAALEHIATLSG